MTHNNFSSTNNRIPFAIIFIAFLLIIVYSTSFSADWHMDDRPNILNNKALHLENLMPENIWMTFFSNQGRKEPKLFRPLACFTFSINWYIGQDNPIGYHIVNFGFHFATAVALFFLIIKCLSLLYSRADQSENTNIHNIALLAALLWAINPIQVQAVTYIVQRMAVMAAFFYVLSILYYVKARTAESQRRKLLYAMLCVVWFLCSFGSKENAIMLPFSLVVTEWVFLQKGRTDFLKWQITWIVGLGLAVIMTGVIFWYTGGTPMETMKGWYNNRPFSLEERLLTQPRVVLMHLSQIFYPLPERFSISHDIMLFRSLFNPWTTLPAIAVIISMTAGALLLAKRYPLFSFAILFFFLNHLIESTVFPLEIVFEHRNYLPSLFLFLPIAAGLCSLLQKLRHNNRVLHAVMAMAVAITITSVGLSTYSRNEVWATGISLWTDAAQKAPNQVRPLVTLGVRLAWQENPSPSDYEFALALFRRALELPEAARNTEKVDILGNIASIYFHRGENERAIQTYMEALDHDPTYLKNRSDLIKPLVVTGNFEEAMNHAAYLIQSRPINSNYLSLMGFILLWMDRPEEALYFLQKALVNGSHRPSLMLNTGVALTRLGSYENGRWFLKQSISKSGGELRPFLAMIENRARAGDDSLASEYARHALYRYSVPVINDLLEKAHSDYRAAPISPHYIEPFIKNHLKQIVLSSS